MSYSIPAAVETGVGKAASVTVKNRGDASGEFRLVCVASAQAPACSTISPNFVWLAPEQSVTMTFQLTGKGLGSFSVRYRLEVDDFKHDSVAVITKVIGLPLIAHFRPVEDGLVEYGDTLVGILSKPDSMTVSSIKTWIDGVERTRTVAGNQMTIAGLSLTGGPHVWKSYGCAVSGRCDTVTTAFHSSGPPTAWSLDDSLPSPQGHGIVPILGGLKLPPPGLRGCPQDVSDPEIRISAPLSFISQPGSGSVPGGLIFAATVSMNDTVRISTLTVDRLATDPTTCADYGYLDRNHFDWGFWIGADSTDGLWDNYPYSDGLAFQLPPDTWLEAGGAYEVAWAGSSTGSGPYPGDPIERPHVAQLLERSVSSAPRREHAGRSTTLAAMLPDPGAINPSTFVLTLNGTQIAQGATGMNGATVEGLWRGGSTVILPGASALLNTFDFLDSAANNGGWNELVATISDSSNNTSSVRARFVHMGSGPVAPLALKSMRNFDHLDQGECAAWGAFQCGGVMLAQTVPGFVTRDKDRSLHLVYRSASQRARLALPVELRIARGQRAPDSLRVQAKVNGVWDTTITRFAGKRGSVTGVNAMNLWEHANEVRVLGAEVAAPATGDAHLQPATIKVTSYFGDPASTVLDDTVSQEIVRLYLSDTLSTRFGQGWQLAEVGRLVLGLTSGASPAALFVSGDGSYSIFRKPASVWVSAPGESSRLAQLGSLLNGARYVLYLPSGASVGFRDDGWQVWTADLLGNRTTYAYHSTTSSRLTSITDPVGKKFLFRYAGTSSQVSSIVIQASASTSDTSRVVSLTYQCPAGGSGSCNGARLRTFSLWRTAALADVTTYGYRPNDPFGAYIDSIIDPRSTVPKPVVTTLAYDNILRLPETMIGPPDRFGGTQYKFRDAWRRAVPREGLGRNGNSGLERLLFPNQMRGTSVDVAGGVSDYQVDPFGAPTYVREVSTGIPINAGAFYVPGSAADAIRTISRDSVGRVTRIVSGNPVATTPDSVMYEYDSKSRVTKMIRSTLAWPRPVVGSDTVALDTVRFTYDTVALATNGAWCSRLLTMRDPYGSLTTTAYGSSGVGRCLPTTITGPAGDQTVLTYASLTAGNVASGRPVRIRDGNLLADSVKYHTGTWNSEIHVRKGDGSQTKAFYNRFGRADSIMDPASKVTRMQYDSIGRVLRQKAGTGPLAPTTRTFISAGGLTDSVQVYASADDALDTPTGGSPIQTTRYFYDRLGRADSIIGPGSRTATDDTRARKQSWLRDRAGNPMYEFVGNGSYIARIYDWQGRPMFVNHSQVSPLLGADKERFADPVSLATYQLFQLGTGKHLSMGQTYNYYYDNKGRVTETTSADQYLGGTLANQRRGYSPTGQLVGDTLIFSDGATVVRWFHYNRRGQRILARDSLVKHAGISVSGELAGETSFSFDSVTGRLSSLTSRTRLEASPYTWQTQATVAWLYDLGGRETQRTVTLGSTSGSNYPVITTRTYDAAGREATIQTTQNSVIRYKFSAPSYSSTDDLLAYAEQRRDLTGNQTNTYSTDGTRRLLTASSSATHHGYNWTYDVFGNRVAETHTNTSGGCTSVVAMSYATAADNRMKVKNSSYQCTPYSRYLTDQAGMRLGSIDSTGGYAGIQSEMTYTAAGQLYMSVTPTSSIGTYDYNWHWYDASGMRFMSHVTQANSIVAAAKPDSAAGLRTYYVYDGSDVALTLVKPVGGSTFRVQQRYATVGVDEVVAGRYWVSGVHQNLAIISDRQGSTITARKADGTEETRAQLFDRNAYGALENAVNGGATGEVNTGTGFTGASNPNATGGFTYLRNRWYDPQTGRFLSQDPIGLAGGTNLYAYAGNNPSSFSDPFGLCEPRCGLLQRAWDKVRAKVDRVYEKFGGKAGVQAGRALEDAGERLSSYATIEHVDVNVDSRAGPLIASYNLANEEWGNGSAGGGLELSIALRGSWAIQPDASGVKTSHGGDLGTGLMIGGTVDMVNGRPNGVSVGVKVGVAIKIPGMVSRMLEGSSIELDK